MDKNSLDPVYIKSYSYKPLMCFNVFSHNQNDHAKKFSFLCHGGDWEVSPAYDVTYSTTFGDGHSTTVRGKGKPSKEDLVSVGAKFGLLERKATAIANDIEAACRDLSKSSLA